MGCFQSKKAKVVRKRMDDGAEQGQKKKDKKAAAKEEAELTGGKDSQAKDEKMRGRDTFSGGPDNQESDPEAAKKLDCPRLLLLGAGESGKSTLFKQMISIYGKGWNAEDRADYVSIIHKNIISAMQTVCSNSQTLAKEGLDTEVDEAAQDSWDFVMEKKENEVITPEVAEHIKTLWKDKGIQTTYNNRNRYHLPDSSSYFFNKIDEIAEEGWIPSEDDVLHSRVRTTGIIENTFNVEGSSFTIVDVGGQRNERKKWIHTFGQSIAAVIFIAALNSYDMVLFEDKSTNRMDESLTLFSEIVNSRWFKNSAVILLLNKIDLFGDKLKKVPLSVCFSDFEGPNTVESGIQFITEQFVSRVKDPNKRVFTFPCSAADQDNVRDILHSVKETLDELGFNKPE
jgi:GTPase SAR1 family protein